MVCRSDWAPSPLVMESTDPKKQIVWLTLDDAGTEVSCAGRGTGRVDSIGSARSYVESSVKKGRSRLLLLLPITMSAEIPREIALFAFANVRQLHRKHQEYLKLSDCNAVLRIRTPSTAKLSLPTEKGVWNVQSLVSCTTYLKVRINRAINLQPRIMILVSVVLNLCAHCRGSVNQ